MTYLTCHPNSFLVQFIDENNINIFFNTTNMSTKTKKIIKQTLLVFGLMAVGLVVFQFVPAFAQGGLAADAPERILVQTGGEGSLRVMIRNFLNFFLGFLGLLAVIMVIYGGVLYVTAAGEQEKVDKGKKIIMYAVVGIVIILLSFAIVNTLLGGLTAGSDT